jgi:uroporphyrinogen decarboxylase
MKSKMTSRERVNTSFAHAQPDVVPIDYFATPEINTMLLEHFGTSSDDELRDILDTDIRYVNPCYDGPELEKYSDGSYMDVWGIRKKPVPNEYGDYAEAINTPYQSWTSADEAESFQWPDPDWYDYSAVASMCKKYPDRAIAVGSFFVQDFINGVARGRGVEQTLIDIATESPVLSYIVERRHKFYMEMIERTLNAAKGRIDLVLCGDDFGSQRGLLISPKSFDTLFKQKKKEFFDMVHNYGANVVHHCCGSSVELWPRFIEIGMDAVQTIQSSAEGMDPFVLKKKYGSEMTLYGAIDVQGWLQNASRSEIDEYLERLIHDVGKNGGFVCSPSHFLQPDIPLANVLYLYETLARYRGKQQ